MMMMMMMVLQQTWRNTTKNMNTNLAECTSTTLTSPVVMVTIVMDAPSRPVDAPLVVSGVFQELYGPTL